VVQKRAGSDARLIGEVAPVTDGIYLEKAATPGRAAAASLEELLTFERLLADLSARFANVSSDRLETEIEGALRQLQDFLDFDRGNFGEFTADGWANILCSVAVDGVERYPPGPVPAHLSWYLGQVRADKIMRVRSLDDLPPEAIEQIEYRRRSGIRSSLGIPLRVGGHIVGLINFSAFRSTREWPDDLIARLKIVGEVMAQALVRKRSEAALRASEARWQSIFETSSIAISTLDRDLHYIATNPAFRAILGYADEELRQLTPADVTFEEERESAQSRLAELQRGSIDHYVVVKRYRCKDGTVIWGHSSMARAPESRPETFIGTMIDITESKRAQDKLLATQTELARVTSLTAAGQMAASMAHEIKQPLAAIVTGGSAGLRWLSKPTPDLEEVRAVLESIVSEGHRASQVIDGIRAMFKNDSREKTLLDVNEVIREVIALLHSEFQKHQISVQAELISELPTVLADRVQLQQVVANLVANAIDAMDTVTDRARTLRVKSLIREPDGVSITVEDSGPGIDPENADRIFHPFFTTKSEGTGMGLSICRSIIEAHNGRLSLLSASVRGSVFEILLPAGDFETIRLARGPLP
jgi:PAS domain S-box-containing protein